MKKNVFAGLAGALLIGSFVFSSLSFKPGSLQELKAKTDYECKWKGINIICDDDQNNHCWGCVLEVR